MQIRSKDAGQGHEAGDGRAARRRSSAPSLVRTSWRAWCIGNSQSAAPDPQDEGAERGVRHHQEAVPAEGHRQCPPGQPARAAIPHRRRGAWPGSARPRLRPSKKVRRLGLISALVAEARRGKAGGDRGRDRRGQDEGIGRTAARARLGFGADRRSPVSMPASRVPAATWHIDLLPTVGGTFTTSCTTTCSRSPAPASKG